MNVLINQLVKSLLQKETLEQCSTHQLLQLAGDYPYFSAVQLLLIKKLQKENSGKYKKQLQKASLHFQSPLWLEHLLNNKGDATVIPATSSGLADASPGKIKDAPVIEEIITQPADVLAYKDPATVSPSSETGIESLEQKVEEPLLNIPTLKIEAIDPDKAELDFEPYHMVDYFASQGIKFNEEERPKDKFGQQLKSFTDWLKIMKRLPVTEIVKTTEINAEQKVEQLAEHSIVDREVVTEAMAEVWEKQGNTAKAMEIYSKLSLLDPLKRPYFAAKIEALKKIN